MFTRTKFPFRHVAAATAAALIGVLVPRLADVASACDSGCPEHAAKAAEVCDAPAQPQAASGMRVSIDPATGEYTEEPQAPSQAEAALAAEPIVPQEEALRSGGYKLDTRGLRHAYVATANPGGLPKTNCVDAAGPATEHQH